MKVAHLILAHNEPIQLKRLVEKLHHVDAFFFIHIDLKTDVQPFTELFVGENQVFFIKQRVKITWAAYSMVQATLNSFKEIKAAEFKIDYINLLSGQDYPLQAMGVFHAFLEKNNGKAFMHCLDVNTVWTEAIPRLQKYHLTNFIDFPGKYKMEQFFNKVLPKRVMPCEMVAVGRSQWFTITFHQMEYILKTLEENPKIGRFFKLTWAPDEIIFQTLLFNSEFKQYIVNNNLRYIDWSEKGKNPKFLVEADFEKLVLSNQFFARKFSQQLDDKIFMKLDSYIK